MAHKIMINCGHGKLQAGGWDAGCVYGSYTEAGLMLPITKAAVKYLRASGVTVLSDADQNNNKNMVADVSWANKEKVELYVSVHCDYKGAPSGVMPLYVSDRGKKLATALNSAIKSGMGMKSRGVIKRTDLYELNATSMCACIIETGSIKADLSILKGKPDQYGKAIAQGICAYLGVAFKTAQNAPESTKTTQSTKETTTEEWFRVRASWSDAKSQKGAFHDLQNAIQCADVNGLNVYNGKGSNVYSSKKDAVQYRVRKAWTDVASQKGAFVDLSKAKALCNKYVGYSVYDNSGKAVHTSTAKTTAQKLVAKLEEMETEMRKLGFRYSNTGSNLASTWADAKKKKYTNCATYVSWALQEIGVLSAGDLFYCKNRKVNNQRGAAADHLKAKATITTVNAVPKSAGLQIGDICGYTTHTQVFAGWDSSGAPLWYTMGGADIGKDLPRVRSDYSTRKIEIRIRLK